MNYKELFQRLFMLFANPKKAWVEISAELPRRDVMSGFVYPLIALGGLVLLMDKLLRGGLDRLSFHDAMMDVCGYCIAFFGGFFLAARLLDMLRQKMLNHGEDMPGSQLFVGYAMGLMFVAEMLTVVFPQFFILFKMVFIGYTLYNVWEGSGILFTIPENKSSKFDVQLMFSVLATIAIVLSPMAIRALFNTLSNILG